MKITINKFKRISDLTIQIPAEIRGGNEFGKTTILEAISFVLTGKNFDGKEFDQVYDYREDIHDAIADVIYFDNYGNSYQRIVKPIFQTSRDGSENMKIKRSTECRKNDIVCNDFSSDFVDFYKFGTGYFFNQKEDVQRSIFIDLLKSKMPNYDIVSAQINKKALKKAINSEIDSINELKKANKNTKDVEVPEISNEILKDNDEYLKLLNANNSDLIKEINKKNNILFSDFRDKKTKIENGIKDLEDDIKEKNDTLLKVKKNLEELEADVFVPKNEITEIKPLKSELRELNEYFDRLEYFETVNDYAKKYFSKNPVCVENAEKIKAIQAGEVDSKTKNCPLTDEFCKIAEENSKLAEINSIKNKNREILEKEMYSVNSIYSNTYHEIEELEAKIERIEKENEKSKAQNDFAKKIYDDNRALLLKTYSDDITKLETSIEYLSNELIMKKFKLSKLIEPTAEKLPEKFEINQSLKDAHTKYEELTKEIHKAQGVNENNVKLIAERNLEIKEIQSKLLILDSEFIKLSNEISEYFNNLKGIVKNEFSGEIEIDVELLEYVMSRDEYNDCFKIIANGKTFPYECNGALQNNVKLQILSHFQRLAKYDGVTIMDNCESNTTQPINTCGLNTVLTFATNDKELIFN